MASQVRLLGPVDVTVDGLPQPVSGLRRKAVLAVLALRAGEVVSTDRLIDVVWGDRAPATALNTLQSHVSYLRGVLGAKAAIVARPPGYVLDLAALAAGAPATDVTAAQHLIAQGMRSPDPGRRAEHLRAALALRRGPPLADVDGLPWFGRQAERLERLLLDSEVALAEARLELGDHAQLVPDLERLTDQHPLHEHIHELLMRALYRSGRQADALTTYDRLRRVLDEELGIPPSPALRELHTAVLKQDPSLAPARRAAGPGQPAAAQGQTHQPPVPAQLPLAVPVFAGREAELASLDALLTRTEGGGTGGPAAVVISAVSGTPGVGKTALAVHWAHRIAARFPDGQLYVNLRGFDGGGSVVDPAEAVRGFLDALRVPPERVPAGLAGQAALYRSVLAGKRVLVVLDNARDAEQVRPLLPGTPGCLAIVTSRVRLTSLVANEGAHPLALDLLTPDEARDLLTRRIGADRAGSEPGAVDELITRCARLPLALAITAAHATTVPSRPLATLAAQLRDTGAALDALDGGDAATDVRAVLSWSYQALSAGAARLLRLLAVHAGPDIGAPAAASLGGVPRREVDRRLAELTATHLVTELAAGRYTFHDLLRAYAAERLEATDSASDQQAARHRMLDHYLRTAHEAAVLMHPQFSTIALPSLCAGVTPEVLAGGEQARVWFTAELPNLLAAARAAARAGYPTHSWQLGWVMTGFLEREGHWQDLYVVASAALDVAGRAGDRTGQAHAHRDLARVCSRLGRHEDALVHASRARELFEEEGDRAGGAHTHLSIGQILDRRGELRPALEHSLRALELFRAAGHAPGEAYTLNAVGWQHALLGNYREALDFCGQALVRLREVGDASGEADTWDSLGYAHHQLGDFPQAITCYRNALDLFAANTDRYSEATALDRLGDSHAAAGDVAAAREAWRGALDILEELGHRDAEQPRSKLSSLSHQPA